MYLSANHYLVFMRMQPYDVDSILNETHLTPRHEKYPVAAPLVFFPEVWS